MSIERLSVSSSVESELWDLATDVFLALNVNPLSVEDTKAISRLFHSHCRDIIQGELLPPPINRRWLTEDQINNMEIYYFEAIESFIGYLSLLENSLQQCRADISDSIKRLMSVILLDIPNELVQHSR